MNQRAHQIADTRRDAPLKRRFAFVAAGLLSVLMAVLGVSFAADSGTSSSTVTNKSGISVTEGNPQDWSVSVGSAGTVPEPGTGDLIAAINPANATSTKMLVSVYVTNLSRLSVNYSSWNFNLSLYDNSTTPVGTEQVLTSDSGTISWVVSTSKQYTLRLEGGGSFYTIGTDTTNGDLSPAFFVRATQL